MVARRVDWMELLLEMILVAKMVEKWVVLKGMLKV